jgi:DNA-binding MurR/RpiR family transcriptional regulator
MGRQSSTLAEHLKNYLQKFNVPARLQQQQTGANVCQNGT